MSDRAETAPATPLPVQIEAVRLAEARQRAMNDGKPVRELRGEQFGKRDIVSLNAAARSLTVLHERADEIRAFLKLPAEAREAVLRHGEALARMCLEQASATAGGAEP